MKIMLLVAMCATSNPNTTTTLSKKTGYAEVHESDIGNKKVIVKTFTDYVRMRREMIISAIVSSFNLKYSPKFVSISDGKIVTEKTNGCELWKRIDNIVGSKKFSDLSDSEKDKIRGIISESFNAMMELHSHGIVHGNISNRNIVVDENGKVVLGDYCESWVGRDYYFDFLRMKNNVLDKTMKTCNVKEYFDLIDQNKIQDEYREAFNHMFKGFYGSKSLMFNKIFDINPVRPNFYIADTISKIFGLGGFDDTRLLNHNYEVILNACKK